LFDSYTQDCWLVSVERFPLDYLCPSLLTFTCAPTDTVCINAYNQLQSCALGCSSEYVSIFDTTKNCEDAMRFFISCFRSCFNAVTTYSSSLLTCYKTAVNDPFSVCYDDLYAAIPNCFDCLPLSDANCGSDTTC